MSSVPLRPIVVLVALALHAASVRAEGEPDTAFGSDGFVFHEQSEIDGEPHIERGLHLGRLPQGDLVVLTQHRFQDADAENHPLVVVFGPGGLLRGASLAAFAFGSPPDPPIAAAAIDATGRALLVGEAGGGQHLLAFATQPIGAGPGFSPVLQSSADVEAGQGDHPRAVVGLPEGDFIVCGLRQFAAPTGTTHLPICRRYSATGTIIAGFGNGSPLAGPGSFFLSDAEIPGLQGGRVLAAGLDRRGRLLLGGSIRLDGVTEELAFAARLLPEGDFDPGFCTVGTCSDAVATSPGWRADAIADTIDYAEGALIERPDGVIARAYDAARASNAEPHVALTLHDADGSLRHADTLQLGAWTRVGGQLAVQADDKVLLPLSYRPEATTQFGAIARLTTDPATQGLLDPAFEFAPAGVTPTSGVAVIRPSPGGGLPATSVECNALQLDVDRVTCAGLVRTSNAPVDLDLMLARVRIVAPTPVHRDGFE
jgi:hypothetical protein